MNTLYINRDNNPSLAEVVYLAADHSYTHIHTKTRSFLNGVTLRKYELQLPSFWRISKHYLVNPDHIQTITQNGGRVNNFVCLKNGTRLQISRRLYIRTRQAFLNRKLLLVTKPKDTSGINATSWQNASTHLGIYKPITL